MKLTDRLRIMVMNVEALSTSKGASAAEWFVRHPGGTMMIVDESTTIKTALQRERRQSSRLAGIANIVVSLQAHPSQKALWIFYREFRYLSWVQQLFCFRARYAVLAQRDGASSFQQLVGYKRLDELNEKIQNFQAGY